MKNLTTQLLILLLSTFWFVTGANAQVTPLGDAYTNSADPKTNYGANGLLDIDGASQTTYIQFNLASIPAGASISQATLKLYVNAVTTAGSFNVDYATGEWTEGTIKYDDSPVLGNTIVSGVAVSTADKNQYILVDITPAVVAWLNGSEPNNGVALVANATFNASFDSKENTTTSHPPELDVVFASTSGSITGVATANGSGLIGGGTTGSLNLSLASCPLGQVLASNGPGAGWACSPVSGGGGGISSTGTANYLALFTTPNSVMDSSLFENTADGSMGIGTTTPGATLDVSGTINAATSFNLGETPFDYGSYANGNAFLGFAGNGTNGSTGQWNTASGYQALFNNVGSGNSAMGNHALFQNTGGYNTASGSDALYANTTGTNNTASGAFALNSDTTGSLNTAAGFGAGQTFDSTNVTGSNDTALGTDTAFSTGTLTNATAIGAYAEVSNSNSLVLGSIAGLNGCNPNATPPTPACQSVMVGIGTPQPGATLDVESPLPNPAPTVTFGNASNPATFIVNGTSNFNGAVNFALNGVGTAVSGNNTSTTGGYGTNGGSFSTAGPGGSGVVGQDFSTAGGYGGYFSSNSAAGAGIWAVNNGGGFAGEFGGNVGISGYETVGGNLTASGVVTGSSFQIGSNLFDYGSPTSNNAFLGFAGNGTNPGSGNTASGWLALAADTTGGSNVASGYNSLLNNTSGSFNTGLGVFAGQTADGSPMTTNNNTFVGAGAEAATGGINNASAIGSNSVVGASYSLVLGSIAGLNNATANTKVGIGTTAPGATLDVEAPSGYAPTVIFGNANQKATLTVNGTANIVGSLTLNGQSITGAGGGISSVSGGSGISATTSNGNVTVSNTGILSISNGQGIRSLGGQNPVVQIDPTAVPLLSTSNTFSGSLIANTSISGANAVQGTSSASTGTGVLGTGNGSGVTGNSSSSTGSGVVGQNFATSGNAYGVWASSSSPTGTGVYGTSAGTGVTGFSSVGIGVYGQSTNAQGVFGTGTTGVVGVATRGSTIFGPGGYFQGFGATANSSLNGTAGVEAFGGQGDPDLAGSVGGAGVMGLGGAGTYTKGLLFQLEQDGQGGVFTGAGAGQFGSGDGVDGIAGSGYAGNFTGNLNVSGSISAGVKDFKIDHPLDPANKYLVHASVESSEMKDIYDGNVTTDGEGHATVQLPEWFSALNKDFRYQLTVIGQFAQAIVAREIESNRFEIRTSLPNVKVSWQVTGVRQDAYAKANPLVVEQEKETYLRGYYIHPEFYGAPGEKQIEWARHPEIMKRIKEHREPSNAIK